MSSIWYSLLGLACFKRELYVWMCCEASLKIVLCELTIPCALVQCFTARGVVRVLSSTLIDSMKRYSMEYAWKERQNGVIYFLREISSPPVPGLETRKYLIELKITKLNLSLGEFPHQIGIPFIVSGCERTTRNETARRK